MLRFIQGTQAWSLYVTGDWNGAVRTAYEFVAECEAGSPHYQEGLVRTVRGLLRHMRGDGEGALEDTARGVELARSVKDPQVLLPALAVRARVCCELGLMEEARTMATEVLASGRHMSLMPRAATGEVSCVANQLGLERELRDVLAPTVRRSRWNAAVIAVLGHDYDRAAQIYAEIGSRPDDADARLRSAAALIESGRREAGEAELGLALEFYRDVGATRSIAEGERLLAA